MSEICLEHKNQRGYECWICLERDVKILEQNNKDLRSALTSSEERIREKDEALKEAIEVAEINCRARGIDTVKNPNLVKWRKAISSASPRQDSAEISQRLPKKCVHGVIAGEDCRACDEYDAIHGSFRHV